MLTCEAPDCLSNENTKIDGKEILLFPCPEDVAQKDQWRQSCRLSENIGNDKPFYVCELHFEEMHFTSSKELKPDAVPTIFNKTEDYQRKRKAEDVFEAESPKTPLLKQKKVDNDSRSLVTPPQSPGVQLIKNVEEMNGENKLDISSNYEILNDCAHSKSELYQDVKLGNKVYRLTIQIDKIYGKPCPKSKKLMALAQIMKKSPLLENLINIDQRDQSSEKVNGKAICAKGGCKLKKSVYDSKPAFQCEHCDKYYVIKKNANQEEKNVCYICHKAFPSLQSLFFHTKTHYVCDICQTECNSQVTYDKHVRLHVSTDPLYPYKCHQCTETFEIKDDIKQHCIIVHPTIKLQNTVLQVTTPPLAQQVLQPQDYRCVTCNITFRNEQAYRNHINSHKSKEGLRCSIGDSPNNIFPVPSPLTGSQIGILRAVKFSCRVCSMEFDNVGEVDKHTRTHLEKDADEDHKCNICTKTFKTIAQLNEHLKYHLARAHSCPVCSKAFINRTTLNIHLKTHET
nr:PREDICTED: zinc finger protein 431-like [Megachile rotundata]XP_012153496.1 PREDICTED: zinc finger protein 431-like [Megachile rotundata]